MAAAGRGTGKGGRGKGAGSARSSAGKGKGAAGPEKGSTGRREETAAKAPGSSANGNGSPPGAGSWAELTDRAARKFSELVDKARPAAEKAGEAGKKMAVDLSGGLDEAFKKISEQARDLASKGQHTRVRIKFRGKQIAELPIAVVAAAEVASLAAFGPFRLVIGHLVGKTVLEVEFVSNADEHVQEGRAHLADGELDKALGEFDKALDMDRRCAGAHLGRGIALKLRGDKAAAKTAFEKAEECDPRGEAGREARRHLDNLV